MQIGVVSDSPALTTGYGIVTSHLVIALLESGHRVHCFGLKDRHENPARVAFPCTIEPVDVFEPWDERLRRFVCDTSPDLLLVYMDIYNLEEVFRYLAPLSALPPIALLLIFDGLPVYPKYLELLSGAHAIWVTTSVACDFLATQGVAVDGVIPPGVDIAVFKPLDMELLKAEAGLQGRFVIGVFGRNTERKQQARVLMALQHLRNRGQADDVMVYFHCLRHGYWRLDEIAESLGVSEYVLFADDLQDETTGVPYTRHSPRTTNRQPSIPKEYGYVERMNVCDLIVNVAHCGDFEQVLIEAQACGVPIAATDDGGIMSWAMGDAGILLPSADISFWKGGQQINHVCVESLAETIKLVRSDHELRERLRARGLEHASRYSWTVMHERIAAATTKLQLDLAIGP